MWISHHWISRLVSWARFSRSSLRGWRTNVDFCDSEIACRVIAYIHIYIYYLYDVCVLYNHIEWADALVPPTPFQVLPLRRCKMRTENWDGLWKPVFCEERRCEGESVCLHLPRLQRECGQWRQDRENRPSNGLREPIFSQGRRCERERW